MIYSSSARSELGLATKAGARRSASVEAMEDGCRWDEDAASKMYGYAFNEGQAEDDRDSKHQQPKRQRADRGR